MHRHLMGCRLAIALALTAAAPNAQAASATAVIQGTTEGSPISGAATFTDTDSGLQIAIVVANVPPGTHGIHIHQFGACDNAGNAAGGHYNPDSAKHGFLPSDGLAGAHAGDLGNIEVDANGHGTLDLIVPSLTVTGGKYSVAGRALILHEKMDDFGQPTGNAGGRIGCGVIVITGE